ncbi:acyl-CoA dehydrogenase family protein [Noviherbaspirillum sp. DKR-6]|uniref:Acyl-CoA dehydrogenase family protein n=1 Tax=Noviherbaspirillum pedocola TaxID=2801341 RepID=A0A934W9C8_9BURK|nr:acyl-CoA dehydrogenase family protein [Noviherbaspirillum pedocola]
MASLARRAERDGDDYMINRTKIWTTHAHWSNKIFCLVRTAPGTKRQQGISFLCFDLNVPCIGPIPSLA